MLTISMKSTQSIHSSTTEQADSLTQKTSINHTVDWQKVFTDDKIEAFLANGFVVFDELFPDAFLQQLQQESGLIDYQIAKLSSGGRIEQIRGDKTHWITSSDLAGSHYLQAIDELATFCNRTFYTGIQFCEAHYACYSIGFGYQWHSDNPKGRNERILSAVFYLNNDWKQTDGGALEIIDNNEQPQLVLPQSNRLVLFDSNLHHQVQIAHRERFSIATWLRRE